MLTILHELGMHRRADGSLDLEGFKIVYVAPMKALVQEVTANFGNRLEPFGEMGLFLSGFFFVFFRFSNSNGSALIITTHRDRHHGARADG